MNCGTLRERGRIVSVRNETQKYAKHILWILLVSMLLMFFAPHSAMAASAKKITMMRGETRQLKRKNVVWMSRNPSVASVSSRGVVTARSGGKAVVIARRGTKKYRYKITVEAPVLNQSAIKIPLDQTAVLRVTGTSKKFRIVSSDPSVVSVVKAKKKNKFRATALKDGVVTVKAVWKNYTISCVVTAGKGKKSSAASGAGTAGAGTADAGTSDSSQPGTITLSYNGTPVQTLTQIRSDVARYVSSVSSFGQSAPLYTSTNGGDGLESIFAPTNNGNINVQGVKLSEAARIGTIQKACLWARAICDSEYHGYDDGQGSGRARYTWGIAKEDSPGTGDYCCYSLTECAYYFAGVNLLGECLGNPSAAIYPPFSTMLFTSRGVSFWGDSKPRSTAPFDCTNYYPKAGFTEITQQKNMAGASFVYQAGDIAVSTNGHQHEQLIISAGTKDKCEVAEACGPGSGKKKGGDQSGGELQVYSKLYKPSEITHVFRFTGEGVVLNTVGLAG